MNIIHAQALPKKQIRGVIPPILNTFSRGGTRWSTRTQVLSWTCVEYQYKLEGHKMKAVKYKPRTHKGQAPGSTGDSRVYDGV